MYFSQLCNKQTNKTTKEAKTTNKNLTYAAYKGIENLWNVSQEILLVVISGEAVWGYWLEEGICLSYYHISSSFEKYRVSLIKYEVIKFGFALCIHFSEEEEKTS